MNGTLLGVVGTYIAYNMSVTISDAYFVSWNDFALRAADKCANHIVCITC